MMPSIPSWQSGRGCIPPLPSSSSLLISFSWSPARVALLHVHSPAPQRRSSCPTVVTAVRGRGSADAGAGASGNGWADGADGQVMTYGSHEIEMAVADLQGPRSKSVKNPSKKISVPARRSVGPSPGSEDALELDAMTSLSGDDETMWCGPDASIMMSRSDSRRFKAEAQLRTIVARQEDITALAEAQSKLRQQSKELQEAKAQMVHQEDEIRELKAQAEQRESYLRVVRADLLEARALADEREQKIRSLGAELSEAGFQRARLKEELATTRAELVEVTAELESLADEILRSSDDEMDVVLVSEAPYMRGTTGTDVPGMFGGSQRDGEGRDEYASPSTGARQLRGSLEGNNWEALANGLASLTRDMLKDAQQDEEAFSIAGLFRGFESLNSERKKD